MFRGWVMLAGTVQRDALSLHRHLCSELLLALLHQHTHTHARTFIHNLLPSPHTERGSLTHVLLRLQTLHVLVALAELLMSAGTHVAASYLASRRHALP